MKGIPRADIKPEVVIGLYESGMTVKQLTDRFDCARQTIYARLNNKPRKKACPKQNGKMCACCGNYPVPEKPLKDGTQLTMLCARCYKNQGISHKVPTR